MRLKNNPHTHTSSAFAAAQIVSSALLIVSCAAIPVDNGTTPESPVPQVASATQSAPTQVRNFPMTFAPAQGTTVEPKTSESVAELAVRALATKRWDDLVKGDIPKAYSYISPTRRKFLSLDAYRSTIKLGVFRTSRVIRVDCADQEVCNAVVAVKVRVVAGRVGAVEQETNLTESWVSADGAWWYVPPL